MECWRGRVALVTGASAGIGAAISKALVIAGMKVVGVARNIDSIQTLADELANEPGSLTPMKCDITKDEEVLSVFTNIKKEFGGVDVCINNAGMSRNKTLLDGTPEDWREMLDLNVVALCLCTKEAVASMKERGVDDGHIIHINSVCGHKVFPKNESHFYTATKYAVTALTEGLRQELVASKSRIRVTSISPGLVTTEFQMRMTQDAAEVERIFSKFPYLMPEDVAASVIHTLSAPPHVQVHEIMMWPI
ncbi:dehydrogenase/reductase SDR family member 11-like [Oratosquilla oratoria]|uniref:dehydrogenase/reductase SDR family member 11-like n=1 Tax=Oratosquilla oratoria TaxID=337810 RepID=UPI003F76BED1